MTDAASGRLVAVDGENGRLALAGAWSVTGPVPSPERAIAEARSRGAKRIAFDASALGHWDSTLLAYVRRLERLAAGGGITVERSGLPEGVTTLLDLARPSEPARRDEKAASWLARFGTSTMAAAAASLDGVRFLGEVIQAAGRSSFRRPGFQGRDLALALHDTGASALPIVALISVLVGMILAFIGAIQLVQFGAEIYVANLVTLGMLREMGAVMAAVIMAGRTGAAFAAELGTMQVNEEIDALSTTGLEPVAFLVLPRLIALVLMMPLLTVYADALGVLGGAVVGIGVLGIPPPLFYDQVLRFVALNDLALGLVKGLVFAFVIGLSGCYHGIRCGRSSAAVGEATTAAVVTGIVGIVVVDAALTVLAHVVGL